MSDRKKVILHTLDVVTQEIKEQVTPETDAETVIFDNGNKLPEELDERLEYTNSDPMPSDVGGLSAGTTFIEQNILDVLNGLLYPYTEPSVVLTTEPAAGIKEKGIILNPIVLSANVVKKSELIKNAAFIKDGNVIKNITGAIPTGGKELYSYTDNVYSNSVFSVKATDNKNNIVESEKAKFTFVYPIYIGSVEASAKTPNETQIKSMVKKVIEVGNLNFGYSITNKRMCIAVPSDWSLNKIVDPNGFDITSSFEASSAVITCLDNTVQNYTVYTSEPTTQMGFVIKYYFLDIGGEEETSTMLLTGPDMNSFIDINTTIFRQSNNPPGADVFPMDISIAGDKSIVTWYDSTSTIQYYYISKDTAYLNTNCSDMFKGKESLIEVDLSGFNGTKTLNMNSMFNGCVNLTTISGINTIAALSIRSMFEKCGSLTSIPMLYLSNVTDATNAFHVNTLSGTNKLTDIAGLYKLEISVDLSQCINLNPASVHNILSGLGIAVVGSIITFNDALRSHIMNIDRSGAKLKGWTVLPPMMVTRFTTGPLFNAAITQKRRAKQYTRTSVSPFSMRDISTTDISLARDGSIVTWFDSTAETQYWYSDNDIIQLSDDCSTMFDGFDILEDIDLEGVDITNSNITNMMHMFSNCPKLLSIDLSSFNTSNVTDMSGIFYGCAALTTLDLLSFNTSNVINMGDMFNGCIGLTALNVSSFDISNATDIHNMFKGCIGLTTLDLSNFDTSNVTNINNMFEGCNALTTLDLSSFNTSNVTDMGYMFRYCSSLITLDLSNFNTSKVTSMDAMFGGCIALSDLKLKEIKFSISFSTCPNLNAESIKYMFANIGDGTGKVFNIDGCIGYNDLRSTDPEVINAISKGWEIQPATKEADDSFIEFTYKAGTAPANTTGYIITGSNSTVDLSQTDKLILKSVKNITSIVYPDDLNIIGLNITNAENLMNIKCAKVDAVENQQSSGVVKFNISGMNKIANMGYSTFNNSPITIGDLSLPNAVNLSEMFIGEGIIFESETPYMNFDSALNVKGMFTGTNFKNTSVTLSISLPKATNIGQIFKNAGGKFSISKFDAPNALRTLDGDTAYNRAYCFAESTLASISGFNIPNAITCEGMFAYCTQLTSVDIAPGGMASTTDTNNMFMDCRLVTSISGLQATERLTDASYMFTACALLETLDLSSINTSNVTNMNSMFMNCNALTTLDLSSFDTSKVTDIDGMFGACGKLTALIGNLNMTSVTTAVSAFDMRGAQGGVNIESEMVNMCPLIGITKKLYIPLMKLNTESIHGILTNLGTATDIGASVIFHKNVESLITDEDRTASKTKGWILYPGIKETTTLKKGSWININSNAISFKRSMVAPDPTIFVDDISEFEDFSVLSWYDSVTKIQYWYSDAGTIYMNPNCAEMFKSRKLLVNIDLTGFNTSKVTDMSGMFQLCPVLATLDISSFDTSNVTKMNSMFNSCPKLRTIVYGENFNKNSSPDITNMFTTCPANKPTWWV